MAGRKAGMIKRRLIEERDRLLAEMEAIRNKIAGLELAITLIEEDDQSPDNPQPTRRRRATTKGAVIDMLRETGADGLNSAIAVQMGERRGLDLDRASVSSLLSRLKRDGIVVHEGDKYQLKEFAATAKPENPFRVIHDNPAA